MFKIKCFINVHVTVGAFGTLPAEVLCTFAPLWEQDEVEKIIVTIIKLTWAP